MRNDAQTHRLGCECRLPLAVRCPGGVSVWAVSNPTPRIHGDGNEREGQSYNLDVSFPLWRFRADGNAVDGTRMLS